MPKVKKQVLKKRKDGRFACRYKDQWFYSAISSDDALQQREQYIRQERNGDYRNKMVTVFDYGIKWIKIAYPNVTDSTFRGLSIHLQHLVNRLGNVSICDVKPLQIKEVYSLEYQNASNSYLKAAKQLFCALFDSALADGLCKINPARQKAAQPHKGTEGGYRAITEQEREWINTYCHDHRAYPAIITMLYAGIRPQEAKALIIEKAIDKKGGMLHITQTAHRKGYNQYEITSKGKSKNANRAVPLFPPVQEALTNRKGLLITTAAGKQITSTTWRNAIDSYKRCMEEKINGMPKRWYGRTKEHKAILAAGKELPPWVEFNIVPYMLRHSFCTWCRDNGVELHTCIDWMGHADATMIMKIYDEVSDNRSKSEAEKLQKTFLSSQNGSQNKEQKQETVDNQEIEEI